MTDAQRAADEPFAVQGRRPRSVAFLWSQFAPYHVDRCEAAAVALGSQYHLLACEVATASKTYAWEPSGDVRGMRKVTLFSGFESEAISWPRKMYRCFNALRKASVVFVGVSYADPDIALLVILLKMAGIRLVLMTESKFDDKERSIPLEALKALGLIFYSAALVGGYRQRDYVRFLGFKRRPIELGYDTVSTDRIRQLAKLSDDGHEPSFAERPFIFVGRFVTKKNILTLIDAYAIYHLEATGVRRRLILVGSGELESKIRDAVASAGLAEWVEFTGFRQAADVAVLLSRSIALVLPSVEEQWGLVVNEALALGLPVLVSDNVGSRDLLVRNGINGYVTPPGDAAVLANAMAAVAVDETHWHRLSSASTILSPAGDTRNFGIAVHRLVNQLLGP